jgi:hypothetical protein
MSTASPCSGTAAPQPRRRARRRGRVLEAQECARRARLRGEGLALTSMHVWFVRAANRKKIYCQRMLIGASHHIHACRGV